MHLGNTEADSLQSFSCKEATIYPEIFFSFWQCLETNAELSTVSNKTLLHQGKGIDCLYEPL